jgi:hypothetical protein
MSQMSQASDNAITMGELMASIGPVGFLLSLFVPVAILAGLLVVLIAPDTKWIKAYLVFALAPLLLGFVARATSEDARQRVLEQNPGASEETLAGLPVTMGLVGTVPCLVIGFAGLVWKSGRRTRRKPRATDPLDRSG